MVDKDDYRDTIASPQEKIVAVLLDIEAYPSWQPGVLETVVEERDEQGRGTVVAMHVDAKVKKVRYRVRYYYDLDAGVLGWDYLDGDLAECTGRYTVTPVTDAETEVAIDITTDVGFFVPGPMKKIIRDQSLKNAMRDLKKRVTA